IRLSSTPRDLVIARQAANVIEHSGYCCEGFSLQTGTGGASLAVTRVLVDKRLRNNITASCGRGGIAGTLVELPENGLL
ncbi:citrate lyase subunit alpha, partial [Salmonella enterica subsp. enterica serovar Infantis]